MVIQFMPLLGSSQICLARPQASPCLVGVEQFPDSPAALTDLLQKEADAQILLFGYTHRAAGDRQSAPQIFAESFLQTLQVHRFTCLVLEVLPVGQTGSAIQQEIDEYNLTGAIGREMASFLPKDDPYYRLILEKAHELGIKIYAGGQSYEKLLECGRTVRRELPIVQTEISDNSLKIIRQLADQDEKVAWFGGCIHNDLAPGKANGHGSFGWRLQAQSTRQVVEIDLVIPEISQQADYYRYLPLPPNCNWQDFIPEQGVAKVLNLKSGSYLFYFPKN